MDAVRTTKIRDARLYGLVRCSLERLDQRLRRERLCEIGRGIRTPAQPRGRYAYRNSRQDVQIIEGERQILIVVDIRHQVRDRGPCLGHTSDKTADVVPDVAEPAIKRLRPRLLGLRLRRLRRHRALGRGCHWLGL